MLATSASSLFFNFKAQESYENLDRIVAIVEKDVITKKELELEINQIINKYKKMNTALPRQEELSKIAMEKLIEKKVVEQYAERKGIRVENQYLDETINDIAKKNNLTIEDLKKSIESEGMPFNLFRDEIKYQIIFNQVKEREIVSKINISEYEVESFINKNKNKNPTQYHIGHIQLITKSNQGDSDEDKAKIEKVIHLLEKESFEDVAKKYSDSPLSTQGGDMGWKKIDELPEIFSNEINDMSIGEISKPILAENGMHLLKLKEVRDGGLFKDKILSQQYNISQIVIKTNEILSENDIIKKLEGIKNQISADLSFADAARQYSEDASSSNGGSLGWVDVSSMLPEYRKVVELSKPNEISGPYSSELGWLLLLVTDSREQDITQEKIHTSARIQLQKSKAEVRVIDWLKVLRDQSTVEILLNE